MDSRSLISGHGRPEPTNYDRSRHAKMNLKPIGYGYFMVNRTTPDLPICGGCGNEIDEHTSVKYSINKRPYHKECFLNA